MNLQVEEILKKHITTVNSFLDENGYNRFTECVEALTSLIEQEGEKAVKKDREAIYRDIVANHNITADEFFEQYLAERKE